MHTDQLFALIKTLSPQNKKAVSLYIKQHYKGKLPNYILLYKLYLKLLDENHKEEAIELIIKARLKRKPYLLKHIANNRRLLKERLFSILLKIENEGNAEQEIEDTIGIIKILIKRKLYEFAQKKIDLAKEQAIAFDFNKKMIDLMMLELDLIWKGSSKDDLVRQSTLRMQLEKYIQLYTKEIQFESLFRQLSLLSERDTMNLKKASRINLEAAYNKNKIEQFDIKAYEKSNHVRLVYWYYRIQNLYFRLMGKPRQSFGFSQKLVKYFEQDSKRKDQFESQYLKSICGYTRACKANNNFLGLNITRSNKGRGFYFGIRMLGLIADLDNNQLFAFKEKLEAFQKTMKNNEYLTGFEKMVLDHLRTFYNIASGNKHNQKEKAILTKKTFKSLKIELNNLTLKPLPINYEEVILWCKSFLQNKTIKEVFEAHN